MTLKQKSTPKPTYAQLQPILWEEDPALQHCICGYVLVSCLPLRQRQCRCRGQLVAQDLRSEACHSEVDGV